ncbi:MAG: serine hydrolase [Gemmatimonadetes bacterium]|nr:serine hydrolase [Gemmatimonadota bacterium]
MRHLLSHSAGLPGYEWLDPRVAAGQPRTNASHLALVSRDAPMPAFVPGSAFSYDNVAYDVAAMVVERVSGASYPDVLAERFFRPLGLTAFVRPARFADWPGNRTRGYRRTNDGMAAHDAYDLEGFHGAANVYLSARDLHKWLAGYRRVVPPQALRNAIRLARLDDGRTTGISLGSWYLSPDTKRRYYTGHHDGFFSVAYADDAQDLTVAWVANDAPPAWLQPALTRALITIAEGGAPETLAPPPVSDAVTDITGTYRVPTLGEVRVRRDGERLIVRVRGVPYDAFAVGGDTHYVPGLDAYLRFGTSASGVRALRWDSIYAVEPSVPRRAPR